MPRIGFLMVKHVSFSGDARATNPCVTGSSDAVRPEVDSMVCPIALRAGVGGHVGVRQDGEVGACRHGAGATPIRHYDNRVPTP